MRHPGEIPDAVWREVEASIEAHRDAEHRAELLKLQDDLLQAANREVALEATIEQLGKDGAALATENERLKVDLSIERRAYDETLYRLKAELAECEAALQLGREGIQAYCDSENAMRDELAEAKNIAKECRDMMIMQMKRESGEFHLSAEAFAPMWGAAITAATKFLAAPPPAESRCTASAGSCNSPKSCGKAGSCIDARMREVAPPAESTPVLDADEPKRVLGMIRNPPAPTDALKTAMARTDPAPPDDIRERPSMYPGPGTAALQRILADHERRLASLESKGEPGAHACDCQEEYCQLRSGLPLTAAHTVHCKGAKP